MTTRVFELTVNFVVSPLDDAINSATPIFRKEQIPGVICSIVPGLLDEISDQEVISPVFGWRFRETTETWKENGGSGRE